MTKTNVVLFEGKEIRKAWDKVAEMWYFSVIDVIGILTDSKNPTDYLKKMRKRDSDLGSYVGTNCPHVEMVGYDGKKRKIIAGNVKAFHPIS